MTTTTQDRPRTDQPTTDQPERRHRFGRHLNRIPNRPAAGHPADDPNVDASWNYRIPEEYQTT